VIVALGLLLVAKALVAAAAAFALACVGLLITAGIVEGAREWRTRRSA
jgi:hypothetical protein